MKFENGKRYEDIKELLTNVKNGVQSVGKIVMEEKGCQESCTKLMVTAKKTLHYTGDLLFILIWTFLFNIYLNGKIEKIKISTATLLLLLNFNLEIYNSS